MSKKEDVGGTLVMLLTELGQQVGRIKPSVVSELTGDDLESLCERAGEVLLLSCDGEGVLTQVLAHFHLN